MKFFTAASLAAAGLVAAQTPANFEPYTNNSLLVDFPYGGGVSVHPVGITLNQSVVAEPPSHISTFAPLDGKYLIAFIDATSTLYDGSSTETLQWLQTGLTQLPGTTVSGPTGPVTVYSFAYNETAPAQYVAPLATKAPANHTFVFLLYKQADDFAPNTYLSKHLAAKPYSRIPFNLTEAELGEPLFASYFTMAQNTTESGVCPQNDGCTSSLVRGVGASDFCYMWTQDVFNVTDPSSLPYFARSCQGTATTPSAAQVSAACECVENKAGATSGASYRDHAGWGEGRWTKKARRGGAVLGGSA